MLVTLKFIAILAASVFAGAALYVNLVEHPARMTLDTKVAAMEWAPSYARATWMQAPLALLSLVSGLGSWLLGANIGWAIAALAVGAVVPFTFLGIMPTNRAILAPGRDLASVETRALLMRWARLHAVRTVLSLHPLDGIGAAASYPKLGWYSSRSRSVPSAERFRIQLRGLVSMARENATCTIRASVPC